MSFITINFALFVLAVLAVFFIAPKKCQWVVLLVASYIFYSLTGLTNLLYILFTTVSTYYCAVLIENKTKEQKDYLITNKETLTKDEKKAYKATMKAKKWKVLLLN